MAIKKVVLDEHLGKGLKKDPSRKKIDVDLTDYVDGSTVTLTPEGKLSSPATGGGGLDCAAISQLPERAWKKGTTILAKQDDECVRLAPLNSIFQEISVTMTSTQLSGVIGTVHHVVVTVTNLGEGTNDLTDLTIVSPQVNTYTTTNFTNSGSKGVTVERKTDWAYAIKKLGSGAVAKVEFDVTTKEAGALQFGASVNPNTALDMQSNNNHTTLTISAFSPTSDEPVTVDCPLISASYNGIPVVVINRLAGNVNDRSLNIVPTADNLAGVKLKLENVGSVRIKGFKKSAPIRESTVFVSLSNSKFGVAQLISDSRPFREITEYSYESSTGTLTINADYYYAVIELNPRGVMCKNQYICLGAALTPTAGRTMTTTAPTSVKSNTFTAGTANLNFDPIKPEQTVNVLSKTVKATGFEYLPGYIDPEVKSAECIDITVPKDGKSYTLTVGGIERPYEDGDGNQNGDLQVSQNENVFTFRALPTAQSTDSFRYGCINFGIV